MKMEYQGAQTSAGPLFALSDAQRARAVQIGDRLRAELNVLLKRTPSTWGSALGMARVLKVDRNSAQKIHAGLSSAIDGAEALARFPGIDALRVFVVAASKAAGMPKADPSVEAAIDAFELLINETGGSRAALVRSLVTAVPSKPTRSDLSRAETSDEHEQRRRLFHDAADLVGYSVESVPFVGLVRQVPGRPDLIEGRRAFGLLGVKWDRGPLALASTAVGVQGNDAPIDTMKHGPLISEHEAWHGLIPEFCSTPLPRFTSRTQGSLSILTADPPSAGVLDVIFGVKWGVDLYPPLTPEQVWSHMTAIRRPTRRLMFDVYMHRAMAAACVPSLGCFGWSAGLLNNPLEYWHERLPGRYPLELLGRGLENSASPHWTRRKELAEYIFSNVGWDPEEFIGFRCDIEYPLWNTIVLMSFDFRGAAGNGARDGGHAGDK